MNKNQINKSRMYGSVDLVLDNHASIFDKQEALKNAHLRLKNGVIQIGQYRQVQEANTSGLTKNKTQLRNSAVAGILHFSAALRSYATLVKNEELKVKTTYRESDLKKAPDPILLDIGILLFGLANQYKDEIAKFFVGETELKEMESLLTSFKLSIPQRRAATSTSKVSTLNIHEVFKSLDQLLKEEMDVLVLLFRTTQPDFYNAYRNARRIVDYAGRGKEKTATALPG